MADSSSVFLCAAAMMVCWSVIGLPLTRRIFGGPATALLAPALGWAIQSAIAFPLFMLIGMSRAVVAGVFAVMTVFGIVALLKGDEARGDAYCRPVAATIAIVTIAALLALVPMLGVMPKDTADGIALSDPIFDHSKVAIVDEIIRAGVPATNPAIASGTPGGRLIYYYLWHFSAAGIAIVTGVSGWAADAALTGFTAFASLLVMAGLAIRFAAGRFLPAVIVFILSMTGSARPILETIFGREQVQSFIGAASGFGGWIFQVSWAPQHVMSAVCIVVAALMIPRLLERGWFAALALGVVAAAAYGSSIWVGAITFGLAAVATTATWLLNLEHSKRRPFILRLATAALVAVLLASPLLVSQLVAAGTIGSPVAFSPVAVFDDLVPDRIRRLLDLPGFWLVYLPIELPALSLSGAIGLRQLVKKSTGESELRALLILVLTSLGVVWLLASVVADNNDLGWRAALPPITVLIAACSAAVDRWIRERRAGLVAVAMIGLVLGLPAGLSTAQGDLQANLDGPADDLSAAVTLWRAVQTETGPDDRVLNNPAYLAGATPWPVNISWALLANRRSCYASEELVLALAPMPTERRKEIAETIARVFSGATSADDIARIAVEYRCNVIVVTPDDNLWWNDVLPGSPAFRLLDAQSGWRIYRRNVP